VGIGPAGQTPFFPLKPDKAMNTIGKIFVFAVLIMSVVFMSFAVAIFSSHTNWQQRATDLDEELAVAQKERAAKEARLTELEEQNTASLRDKDEVINKLEAALAEKDSELQDLRKKRDADLEKLSGDIEALAAAKLERDKAEKLVNDLRQEIDGLQENLQSSVNRGAELAAKLHQAESELSMATERKKQLEIQVSNAREVLQQNGLSLERPKHIVPIVDGVITAVADDLVEVSIGSDDGLQPGHELEVFRADQYVGRLRVVSVKPDRAVVRILKDYARGIVQRGDRVATKLKLNG
jgi:hypothetical protein